MKPLSFFFPATWLHRIFPALLTEEQSSGGVIRATVEVQVAEPNPEPKEQHNMQRDIYTFTLNLKNLIRISMHDPRARVEIFEAINEGPLTHTEKLGAANLKAGADAPDSWYTVFAGTSREVQPGQEGFLLRNQAGDRISMRLRAQTRKDHAAVTSQQPVADGGTELLRRAMDGDPEAARIVLQLAQLQSGTQAPTNVTEPAPAPELPMVSSPFQVGTEAMASACDPDDCCDEPDAGFQVEDDAPVVTEGESDTPPEMPDLG